MHKRDVYANLLQDTRGLRREQAIARETWFAELELDGKEQCLFELEMLLKGIVCFGNPRNHPRLQPRKFNPVSHDFVRELHILRDALERSILLCRQLLGEREKAFSFFRYLETVMPSDATRTQLLKDQLTQNTPEEALFLLRHAFSGYVEMIDGLLKTDRVSNRTFHAVHLTVAREIGRNVYFNPLVALEFRAEFDRIRNVQVLDALSAVDSDAAHRVTALTLLTLFRALRYLVLIERYASEPGSVLRSYIVCAVLRSDLRALGSYLEHGSAELVCNGFERELLSLPAMEVVQFYDDLRQIGQDLRNVCDALKSVASNLGLEVSRVFDDELYALSAEVELSEFADQLIVVTAQLRSALHHSVRTVCSQLLPDQITLDLENDTAVRVASSRRLRREVWMLHQVVKAFIAKATAENVPPNQWNGYSNVRFVKEFVDHFRAIGYQLVRMNDYHRLDPFMNSLERLRATDLLDLHNLNEVIQEAQTFEAYLQQLFDQISKRSELEVFPFDRRKAAQTLRKYLERNSYVGP
jgi:hypothetical protein